MHQIEIGGGQGACLDARVLDGMFALRHEVFRERLGWEVRSQARREHDRYDQLDPVYIVAADNARRVQGCWRLLPTCGDYMLRDTFPELLAGEPAPISSRIWELSRFAVAARGGSSRVMHEVTLQLLEAAFDFAASQGIDHYVTVTSVALERLMKHAGIPLRRFGDGRARRVGEVLSVACWVDIDERVGEAICACRDQLSCAREAA